MAGRTVSLFAMSFITKKRFYELRGRTVRAQEALIARGVWEKGKHWALIHGSQMIDIESVDALAREIAENQVEALMRKRPRRRRPGVAAKLR